MYKFKEVLEVDNSNHWTIDRYTTDDEGELTLDTTGYPNNNLVIPEFDAVKNPIKSVYIPPHKWETFDFSQAKQLEVIGTTVHGETKITEVPVFLPSSIVSIEDNAFAGYDVCTKIDFSRLPNLTNIGEGAFKDWWGASLIDSTRGVAYLSFSGCRNLLTIGRNSFSRIFEDVPEDYRTILDFTGCDKLRVNISAFSPKAKISEVRLPEGESIAKAIATSFMYDRIRSEEPITFKNSTLDLTVRLSNVHTVDGKIARIYAGKNYFEQKEKQLNSMEVSHTANTVEELLNILANNSKDVDVLYKEEGGFAYLIQYSVRESKASAKLIGFSDKILQCIKIPATVKGTDIPVKSIEDQAFVDTVGERSIVRNPVDFTEAKNLERIGKEAFSWSTMEDIDLGNCHKLTVIEDKAFNGCTYTSLRLPNSVKYLGVSAFKYSGWSKPELKNIPESLTDVNLEALAGVRWVKFYTDKDNAETLYKCKEILPDLMGELIYSKYKDYHLIVQDHSPLIKILQSRCNSARKYGSNSEDANLETQINIYEELVYGKGLSPKKANRRHTKNYLEERQAEVDKIRKSLEEIREEMELEALNGFENMHRLQGYDPGIFSDSSTNLTDTVKLTKKLERLTSEILLIQYNAF